MRACRFMTLVAVVIACGLCNAEAFARPGRGGGAGAGARPGGAGPRPEGAVQRPAGNLERAKPNANGAFSDGAARKQAGPATKQQLNNFLNPAGEGAGRGDLANEANRQEKANQFQSSRKTDARQAAADAAFSPAWYKAHPNAWKFAHPHADAVAVASAFAVGRWFGYGATGVAYDPYYDDYDDYAYNASTPSDAEQVAQAQALAQVTTNDAATTDADWLSLGVYALVRDAQAEPNVLVQLEVSRDGLVRGSWYDVKTNSSQPLQGSVDKSSQAVAFSTSPASDTYFETTVGNLTEDSAPILIHFSNGNTEKWLAIRQTASTEAK